MNNFPDNTSEELDQIFLQHNAEISVIQRHEGDYASATDLYKAFQLSEDKTKDAINTLIAQRENALLEKVITMSQSYPIHGGIDSYYPAYRVTAVPVAAIKELSPRLLETKEDK